MSSGFPFWWGRVILKVVRVKQEREEEQEEGKDQGRKRRERRRAAGEPVMSRLERCRWRGPRSRS